MELVENRPCLRNGERESEEREGAGIPRLPLERSKCHFCLNTMIFVWRERLSCFCPGSKGHGCGPENKPLRISETTLTYDSGEGERYSMPLAPNCEIAQRQSKISMADEEGRKEDIKGFAPTTCTKMATKCEDERMRGSRRLLLRCF